MSISAMSPASARRNTKRDYTHQPSMSLKDHGLSALLAISVVGAVVGLALVGIVERTFERIAPAFRGYG